LSTWWNQTRVSLLLGLLVARKEERWETRSRRLLEERWETRSRRLLVARKEDLLQGRTPRKIPMLRRQNVPIATLKSEQKETVIRFILMGKRSTVGCIIFLCNITHSTNLLINLYCNT